MRGYNAAHTFNNNRFNSDSVRWNSNGYSGYKNVANGDSYLHSPCKFSTFYKDLILGLVSP